MITGEPQAKPGMDKETETTRSACRKLEMKSLAFVSGKGGVGKTTTAVNFAILCAKKGLRTALLDLDPLSDVAALLDITAPESSVRDGQTGARASSWRDDGSAVTTPVLGNLDLLFPAQKLSTGTRDDLYRFIYEEYAGVLATRYDILVFDMPAGNDREENLRYLPHMKEIVLVTNPEPTAHVAAGYFIAKAREHLPGLSVRLWHNRYAPDPGWEFDPRDVVGTYNRNVPEEDRLPPETRKRLIDTAVVPPDRSLDLLRSDPDLILLLQRNLLTLLQSMLEAHIVGITASLPFSAHVRGILTTYLSHAGQIDDVRTKLSELGEYLVRFVIGNLTRSDSAEAAGAGFSAPPSFAASPFTSEEAAILEALLGGLAGDKLRGLLLRQILIVEGQINSRRPAGRPFTADVPGAGGTPLDRTLPEFLMLIAGTVDLPAVMKHHSGVLLFYFSLYKLFQSQTMRALVTGFIPKKTTGRGEVIRDRLRQIRNLIEGGEEYRRRYLSLIRSIYPIAMRQISTVTKTFDLDTLLFHSGTAVNEKVYLRLLTGFLHDAVNSGLGVVVGFDYRPAAVGFREGAERLLAAFTERS